VTFSWTLSAAFRPALWRFLRVGIGVGLAVATKYTGIGAAIPIAGFTLVRGFPGRGHRRIWLWLALAGFASVVVFVILNPYLGVVLDYIPKQLTHYAGNARQRGSDHGVVLLQQAQFLLEHHGPIVASFAAAGLIGLLWRVFRPVDWSPERRLGVALALGHFLGYSAFHASAATLFRGQNYLLVAPFSSLFAAWAFFELWRLLSYRAAWLRKASVTAALCLTPAAWLLWEQGRLVYERVIPTTWSKAGEVLMAELKSLELRQVIYETPDETARLLHGAGQAITTGTDRLARIDPEILDRADAEIFPRSRFLGSEADFYREREARLEKGRVRVVSNAPFETRGETIVILLHPWRPTSMPEPLVLGRPAPARALAARLPEELKPGEVASLVLWIPREAGQVDALRIEPGGRRLPLTETGRRGKRRRLVTARFELTGQEARVRIPAPPEVPVRSYRLELVRWQK
jgi:hypothetical protein